METLSFVPEASNPQTQIELSGIEALGKANGVPPGTVVAPVVKVKTPVDDTL
jgi:hypothetical protein